MKNKITLPAFLLFCMLVVLFGLYLGQAAHHNCSRCDDNAHRGAEVKPAGTIP